MALFLQNEWQYENFLVFLQPCTQERPQRHICSNSPVELAPHTEKEE